MRCRTGSFGLLLALAAACNGPEAEPTGPNGKHPGGKADAFGRFLIGLASEYEPADPPLDEMALHRDMKQRRDAAWRTIAKVVEPVELFGLADPQKCSRVDPFEGVREDCEPIDTEFCTKARLAEGASPDGEGDKKCTPIPTLPRWQTWYGEEDIKQMLRFLLEDLGKEGRKDRKPFSAEKIERAFLHIATQTDRLRTWPVERLVKELNKLADCEGAQDEEACAQLQQDQLAGRAGSGLARIYFSPEAVRHILRNYKPISECEEILKDLPIDAEERSPTNFSACFDAEFPENSAIVKAQWIRSLIGEGGQPIAMPVWDTSAPALKKMLAGEANWLSEEMTEHCRLGEASELKEEAAAIGVRCVNPAKDEVFTIKLSSGAEYRLGGLHVMTKEVRHWHWASIWFSDDPDSDFGADRPNVFGGEEEVIDPDPYDYYDDWDDYGWGSSSTGWWYGSTTWDEEDEAPDDDAVTAKTIWDNYKLCAVGARTHTPEHPDKLYAEGDPNPGGHDYPATLSDALRAGSAEQGDPTWCSNPYIEHGPGNAKTNCIGCHQHGGAKVGPDMEPFDLEQVISKEDLYPEVGREHIRAVFPADYTWSYSRQTNFSQIIMTELEGFDAQDGTLTNNVADIDEVMDLWERDAGDAARGEALFKADRPEIKENEGPCSVCHGEDALGGEGPNLSRRVPNLGDRDLAGAILKGRLRMPPWESVLDANEVVDLMKFLRDRFGDGS